MFLEISQNSQENTCAFYRTPLGDCLCILNILNNFITYETIVCNHRDPPLFNDKTKLLIKEKTTVYKYFRQNAYWYHRLKVFQDRLNNFIESSKEKYYNRIASKL